MPEKLEERVALLEAEVARLKNKVESNSFYKPWWKLLEHLLIILPMMRRCNWLENTVNLCAQIIPSNPKIKCRLLILIV